MSWATVFANLVAGNQPLALFDAMFAQIATLVAVPTSGVGTNAITLTGLSNAPTITAYNNYQMFRFIGPNTSTGPVTAQYQSLASLPVYTKDGLTQANANNIVAGRDYMLVYSSALNGGSGGFFLEDPGALVSGTFGVGQGGTGLNALTAYAVLLGGTNSGAAMQQVTGVGSAGQVLTSAGAAAKPTWQTPSGGGGGAPIVPAAQLLTTSQTVTIPTNASKLLIFLVGGGGGGAGGVLSITCCVASGNGGPGGPAGVLVKYLSGLTAGNTLILTIGAAGTAGAAGLNSGGAGGNSSLASGTQTIPATLTAQGGGGGVANDGAGGAGSGVNGDLNWTGSVGVTGLGFGLPGPAALSNSNGNPGQGYGGPGSAGQSSTVGIGQAGGAGKGGAAILIWFT